MDLQHITKQRFSAYLIAQTGHRPPQFLVQGYFTQVEAFRVLLELLPGDVGLDLKSPYETVARALTLEGARAVIRRQLARSRAPQRPLGRSSPALPLGASPFSFAGSARTPAYAPIGPCKGSPGTTV